MAGMAEQLSVFGLAGKTAIVTGAASGIGLATAELFADVGAEVMLIDLDGERVKEVAGRIGRRAIGLSCDIADQEAVSRVFAEAMLRFGRLDVLANVAAYRQKADTMTMPASEWDAMHAVTTRGTFLCMREAIRIMLRQEHGGAIVNTSSVSALHPTIFSNMHYDSAKAGVDAMTRAAVVEFGVRGIRVNSVQPGGTASATAQRLQSGAEPVTGPITNPGRIPLGRLAEPIEQARAILFLASPAASYINGHHLTVDGGYLVS